MWILCYIHSPHFLHCLMYVGYRPILDAMKTFAVEKQDGVVDIEVRIIIFYTPLTTVQQNCGMFSESVHLTNQVTPLGRSTSSWSARWPILYIDRVITSLTQSCHRISRRSSALGLASRALTTPLHVSPHHWGRGRWSAPLCGMLPLHWRACCPSYPTIQTAVWDWWLETQAEVSGSPLVRIYLVRWTGLMVIQY